MIQRVEFWIHERVPLCVFLCDGYMNCRILSAIYGKIPKKCGQSSVPHNPGYDLGWFSRISRHNGHSTTQMNAIKFPVWLIGSCSILSKYLSEDRLHNCAFLFITLANIIILSSSFSCRSQCSLSLSVELSSLLRPWASMFYRRSKTQPPGAELISSLRTMSDSAPMSPRFVKSILGPAAGQWHIERTCGL